MEVSRTSLANSVMGLHGWAVRPADKMKDPAGRTPRAAWAEEGTGVQIGEFMPYQASSTRTSCRYSVGIPSTSLTSFLQQVACCPKKRPIAGVALPKGHVSTRVVGVGKSAGVKSRAEFHRQQCCLRHCISWGLASAKTAWAAWKASMVIG